MKKLNVNLLENSYNIIIGENYIRDFPKYIEEVYAGNKLFVITDKNIDKIYRDKYEDMFKGFDYEIYLLEPGEKNKNLEVVNKIYSSMVMSNIKRNNMVIAFGGGVVGDIAGFVAATFLRGIDFIQIPTTVISQVDSSIGGKVGVDLVEGKNLVGAFHQPKLVLIDKNFLNSLEDRYFFDGFAEIVKYGCIYDEEFFEELENLVEKSESLCGNKLREILMENIINIIYKSCEIKKNIVEKDEKEENLRMILNFGHTIGHGIEQYTNYETYTHGEAISIGMIDIIKIGVKKKITEKNQLERVEKLLKKLNLPISLDYSIEKIKGIMKRDKKSNENSINFVFLKKIGKVEIIKMKLEDFFE